MWGHHRPQMFSIRVTGRLEGVNPLPQTGIRNKAGRKVSTTMEREASWVIGDSQRKQLIILGRACVHGSYV